MRNVRMNASQLINQTSGDVEIYTPSNIIEAARTCMGGIDLDPASSALANERVKARMFFDEKADGRYAGWCGRVWLNHPFSREWNKVWVSKAIHEYKERRVEALCMICFASTSEAWFRPLLRYPQCFLSPRTNYLRPDGTIYRGVTKGSVVTYMGPDLDAFARAFAPLGEIKVSYTPQPANREGGREIL
jgi:hypothetical protein